ncbi:Sodium/calcium exchanger protein-domain-containing protein [Mycena capillaripes]|nr:Sodium/calcium exchanger protein-domain-containing protein [Mycena capillaripes]
MRYTHQSATLIFVFYCAADNVGGLLNATLGNIVEMIIAGIALKQAMYMNITLYLSNILQCKLELVESSLLGGLLSNMLLILGMAFIGDTVGGFCFHSHEFQPMVAQLNSSLMTVSVISLLVPAAFARIQVLILLQLSRGSAIVLILIYLFFQFYSHSHLFLPTENLPHSSISQADNAALPLRAGRTPEFGNIEYPKINTPVALLVLVAATGLAFLTAEHFVASLEGLVAAYPNISEKWFTLIVIPVTGNAAEHLTAVVVASKGKFDLAMSVAIGSCIQISLFVIPVLILIAWGMTKPLTLLFDPLETLVLFLSVILIKFSVEDGKAHWMSGVVLLAVYTLIVLSFWNFPDTVRMLQGQELVCT